MKYHLLSLLQRIADPFYSNLLPEGKNVYSKEICSPTNSDEDMQYKIAYTPP